MTTGEPWGRLQHTFGRPRDGGAGLARHLTPAPSLLVSRNRDSPAALAAALVISGLAPGATQHCLLSSEPKIPALREAAKALGLRGWLVMRLVILPQAVRRMLPPYVNQSITQLKNTSLVSVIAVPDLVYNATLINADTYRPLEVYTVVAVIYFLILFPATLIAQRLEKSLAHDRA